MRPIYQFGAIFLVLLVAGWWFFQWQGLPSTKAADFTIQDVISKLPNPNMAECVVEIGSFISEPDVLGPHSEGAIGEYNGNHFLVSGFSHYLQNHLLTSPRVDQLPREQRHWVPVAQQAPINGSHFQAAITGPLMWIAGGYIGDSPGKATDTLWRYNLQTDVWSEGTKLPSKRAGGGFVALGSELHYVSGLAPDRETNLTEHISLDTQTQEGWKVVSEFPRSRAHFQTVNIGGFLYAVGGMKGHDKTRVDVPHVDVYHPEYGQWLAVAGLPESRSHAEMGTFEFEDRIIVVGGRVGSRILESDSSILEYNPYKNEWRHVGSLPMGMYGGFAFVKEGRLYAGGGGRIWKEPNIKSWSAKIDMACE